MQDVQEDRIQDLQDNDLDGKDCLSKEITYQITHIYYIDNNIKEFNNVILNEDQDEESDDDEHDKQSVEALHYIAGCIAFKFKTKYPNLQLREEKTKQKQILLKSQGLLVTPSEQLNKPLQQCETIFCHFHGSTVDMNPNPMKDQQKTLCQIMQNYQLKLLNCLSNFVFFNE